MQRGELGRAERGRLRHEMFSEKIGVLDHGALERLENHAAFLRSVSGSDVALEQLVVGENQPAGDLLESA